MASLFASSKKHSNNGAQAEEQHDDFLDGVTNDDLAEVLKGVRQRDPEQKEYLQAVKEVALSLQPVFERDPQFVKAFAQLTEPERQVIFRVPWLDDKGNIRINRGWRVQFSSAIGPYKGGLRFHPSVTLSVIKFLGFEQIFKNALTTLPMGGGKGGSDFDPKGKSDPEIMKFCQSFMTELHRHIGRNMDVPAGDIGVSTREIGYLFGQYKRITGDFEPVLTGKGTAWGGSKIRPEATGYGAVFFAEEVLKDDDDSIKDKRCVVSGSGNVAQYCAKKLVEEGAKVLAMSDSKGYVYEKDGFTMEQVEQIMKIKSKHDGKLENYDSESGSYVKGKKPWEIDSEYDLAFPCATQNEIDIEEAKTIASKGAKGVYEGANMPCTPAAVKHFKEKGVLYAPGKAVNAGGVAVSGLEITQQALGMPWSECEVHDKLREIMRSIYKATRDAAKEYDTDLAAGANIAAFLKVADAVLAQGAV